MRAPHLLPDCPKWVGEGGGGDSDVERSGTLVVSLRVCSSGVHDETPLFLPVTVFRCFSGIFKG